MKKKKSKKTLSVIAATGLCLSVVSCHKETESLETAHSKSDIPCKETILQDFTDTTVLSSSDVGSNGMNEDAVTIGGHQTSSDLTVDVKPIITPNEEETMVQTDIILNFQSYATDLPYELSFDTFQIPDEQQYYYCEKKEAENQIILGHRAKSETYLYSMYYGGILHYTVCTDLDTNLVFLQGEGFSLCDINHDGDYEVRYKDQLLMNTSDGIMTANLDTAFHNYITSIVPLNAKYTYNIGNNSFQYIIYTGSEEAYEEHNMVLRFTGNGFDIVYDRLYYYDKFASFESNDPDWTVTVSYTDVPDPYKLSGEDENIYQLYTLNIIGSYGQNYVFYENMPFPSENQNTINTNRYCDAKLDRKLIVHPKHEYALLIYPLTTETADEMQGTDFRLIDLKTGNMITDEILTAKEIINAQFASHDEAYAVLGQCDDIGFNKNTIMEEIEIVENGFLIKVNVRNMNEELIVNGKYEINLNNLQPQLEN